MQKELEVPSFQKFQYDFTAHIRNPKLHPKPKGIELRRMKIYSELLFNGIEDVISNCYPVLKMVLGKKKWTLLIRDFFSNHYSQEPFYREIPREFLKFFQTERKSDLKDFPFLTELAHYEWIELDLLRSNLSVDHSQIKTPQNWLDEKIAYHPVMAFLSYHYPVHQIGPQFKPKTPSDIPYYYLVYRNPEDDIEFVILNSITARLVDLTLNSELSLKEAIIQIGNELNHSNLKVIEQGALEIIEELYEKKIILGVWKN